MRAVPLAADVGPLEVLYEDNDLLAVNKPPGIITAPRHRYVGGSMVNRVKGEGTWAGAAALERALPSCRLAGAHCHGALPSRLTARRWLACCFWACRAACRARYPALPAEAAAACACPQARSAGSRWCCTA
jgi:hypothetical protein